MQPAISDYSSNNARAAWADFKQVFDGTLSRPFFSSYAQTGKIPANFPVLTSHDKGKVDLLLNDYWTFSGTVGAYNNQLTNHREYLSRFIDYLKRQYDLD